MEKGHWSVVGGRKQRSLGASREGRAEEVGVVRTELHSEEPSWPQGERDAEAPPPRPPGMGASVIS